MSCGDGLSIVIVSYNARTYLDRALGAVESLYGLQNGFVSAHLGQTLVYRKA